MQGPKTLLECEDHWVTDMGAWFPGERVVFRGKDLFQELGDSSWMGLLLYGITGREFNEKQIRLFEGIWTLSTSYPDPRLWNNRVAALAGSARSTPVLGISAATGVSEASLYGRRPDIRSIDFLYRANTKLKAGDSLENIVKSELKKYRNIYGYGRPIVRTDERIAPLMSLANQLGFGEGEFVSLSFAVEKILLGGRWRMHMNIAAVISGLTADLGLSTREHYLYLTLCFSAGMFACNVDTFTKPEGSLFPLRCSRINYNGARRRNWKK
jgi:hypothetical protein